MFKNKISRKLSMYFALALLIFAVIIGSVFVMLFRNQSVNSHKTELESHAKDIAQGLSSYLDQSSNRMSGFGRYLKMLASISGTPVLNPSNEVIGVVLLHSPVEGVDDAILHTWFIGSSPRWYCHRA